MGVGGGGRESGKERGGKGGRGREKHTLSNILSNIHIHVSYDVSMLIRGLTASFVW